MNKDERVMAERMVRTAPIQGYQVAEGYVRVNTGFLNKLHEACLKRDQLQLVTRRRYGPNHGTGHRKQSSGRLRAIELTENPKPAFATNLLHDRNEIERRFANLTNWGGGLTCLPPWVRTHRRVHRWVQAKLVLTAVKRADCSTTYVA